MTARMNRSGYLLEFISARGAIKVCAIDPITGTEVSIVGSPTASQAHMERVAVQKLEYVLNRDNPDPMPEQPKGPGVIV